MTHVQRWWWIAVFVAGCASTPAPPRELVHTQPFAVNEMVTQGSSEFWKVQDGEIICGLKPTRVLPIPAGLRVQAALQHEVDDVEYLLVGTVDVAGTWRLHRYHDRDADRLIDVETRVHLATFSAGPALITNLERIGWTGEYFALDRRLQDVWRVRDTDSDGFPDTFDKQPVATMRDFPSLRDIAALRSYDEYTVVLLPGRKYLSVLRGCLPENPMTGTAYLLDRTRDGRMDRVERIPWDFMVLYSSWPPHVQGWFYAGQSELHVMSAPGELAELWTVKAPTRIARESDRLERLGSVTPDSYAWTRMRLSRPLREGETVEVVSGGGGGVRETVTERIPEALALEDNELSCSGGAARVQVRNFKPGTTVTLLAQSTELAIPYEQVDEHTIQLMLPPLGDEFAGPGILIVKELGADRTSVLPVYLARVGAQRNRDE